MNKKSMVATIATALLLAIPGSAQSAADLLQKGIYAQETAGDLDSAIRIFRQVANPSSGNRTVAAQAQYQLVLCMLQRGDRTAAAKEVETLSRSFPDQAELISKARKLLPGGSAMLPAPWGESEVSQLNIKRDGAPTGEYLYYSVDPASGVPFIPANPNHQYLRWELETKKSHRTALVAIDRTTGQASGQPQLRANDKAGDPLAEPFAGPMIDIQMSVFAMRRLPLAVGYKTTLTTLPLAQSHVIPKEVELSVTGIEPVKVTAGEFKCYKVSFASLGQTFWFGVEGARPLVKFQSGNTEAELVKIWGAENLIETELAFFNDAGWKFDNVRMGPGPDGNGRVREERQSQEGTLMLAISARKIYTPPSEIAKALRDALPTEDGQKCEPETVQMRTIGGQQAVSCLITNGARYNIWIRTQTASIVLSGNASFEGSAVFKWQIDRVLATAKRIP